MYFCYLSFNVENVHDDKWLSGKANNENTHYFSFWKNRELTFRLVFHEVSFSK